MGLTPQQTQVQCVNRTMDHGFDPTIDTSTGCKWDHGFDPTTDRSTRCKWDHRFDPKADKSTGCKWEHEFDRITDTKVVNRTMDLILQQTQVQGVNGSMSLTP